MIVFLNENNKLELTEKAMMIKDFRDLYYYYAVKLKNEDRAMAAFATLYFMHHFDSQFLVDYPNDLEQRFKAVQKFVYKGDEITKIKVYVQAEKTYLSLIDKEQTVLYVVMKRNVQKLKEYAENMVLIKSAGGSKEEIAEDVIKETLEVKVNWKEFNDINSSLPDQEEKLRKFKERLMEHFKSEVDIYGGGDTGAYE